MVTIVLHQALEYAYDSCSLNTEVGDEFKNNTTRRVLRDTVKEDKASRGRLMLGTCGD